MKNEGDSGRDTRLDPLDVVPDPTVPGQVLLPDPTEVIARDQVFAPDPTEVLEVPPAAAPAPFARRAPPLPSQRATGAPFPRAPVAPPTPRLGGASRAPNPLLRSGAVAPSRDVGADTSPYAPDLRDAVGTATEPNDATTPHRRMGPPPAPAHARTLDGLGAHQPPAAAFAAAGLPAPAAPVPTADLLSGATDAYPIAVGAAPFGASGDTVANFTVPVAAPEADLGAPPPLGAPLMRPRLPTQPMMGTNGRDVVFLPTEGPDALTPSDLGSLRASDMPPADAVRARAPRLTSGWPFLPLAPVLVVIIGLAVAFAIGLVGLDQLARAGEEHAGQRAELLAVTVAARLANLPAARRLDATLFAQRRGHAEMVVVSNAAEIVYDATVGAPDANALRHMLAHRKGTLVMQRMGRARYFVQPVDARESLIVLVPEPPAEGGSALLSALAALTVLLLGSAAGVAYAVSRDITRDVDFVTDRVRTMAQIRTEPTGELIPARTLDEIGILTATFNKLVARFGRASAAYRGDLARASVADRERAAFLAAVSHELRSPLNAILGFADILMEEVDGPLSPSAKEEVEQIRGSGQHLLGLINDILEFSALEAGQLRLARSRVDIYALANEVVKEARGLVGNRPLVVRVEGESLIARIDGRRVRQIVGNLVNNAIKFTQQGEVVVRVRRVGAQAVLSVTDTGPGISEADRALIFEEFQQAKTERGRRRGTGLGLAITRRLVTLHHGTITVQSELGRGSTFDVSLPIGNIDAPPSRKLNGPGLSSLPPPMDSLAPEAPSVPPTWGR